MGTGYLIDSNVIIDFFNGKLPLNGRIFVAAIQPQISIITNIEIFATKNIPQKEYVLLQKFVSKATIYPLNIDLVNTTIDIRQNQKLKLADAIIAATALVHNLTLVTRNTKDFVNIKGLRLINPWDDSTFE